MDKDIITIQQEIDKQLGNKEVAMLLLQTTFKGLQAPVMKQAIMEGTIRGFTFKDFLEKNVYAIPFKDGYSLVSSIDYARKIGMHSGIVGTSKPIYEKSDSDSTCSITVKKKVGGYVGDFTATVFFKEYSTGRNLWTTKPKTMIAKVAEMHALRMACPEELTQSYVEEELDKETSKPIVIIEDSKTKLESVKNLEELKTVWSSLPAESKKELSALKDELKVKFTPKNENPKI